MEQPAYVKVRNAIKDRALYLALLVRQFSTALPPDKVEELARKAIYEYGRIKGKQDGKRMTPDELMEPHLTSKERSAIFATHIIKGPDFVEQQMTYCPMMDAWRELGCSAEEMDRLCDIAMEVDRGQCDYHGIPLDIPARMGRGDERCRLVFKKA